MTCSQKCTFSSLLQEIGLIFTGIIFLSFRHSPPALHQHNEGRKRRELRHPLAQQQGFPLLPGGREDPRRAQQEGSHDGKRRRRKRRREEFNKWGGNGRGRLKSNSGLLSLLVMLFLSDIDLIKPAIFFMVIVPPM